MPILRPTLFSTSFIFFLLVSLSSQSAFGSKNPCKHKHRPKTIKIVEPFTTKFFTQTLDHYSYNPNSYHTFQQRYLINDTYWGGNQTKAPIFVVIGHGDNIKTIAEETGLLFEIAPAFKSLTIFIEHRYYGESFPFGNLKDAYKDTGRLGYLSTAQALGDVATLITDLKRNLSAEESPVVVFGAAYGGNLAAWFRLKYPHIAIGAVASSAPILLFKGLISPYKITDIITYDYRSRSEPCYWTIKSWWGAIDQLARTDVNKLADSLKICENVARDEILGAKITAWVEASLTFAAIADYSKPSTTPPFLPAYPVRQICEAVDHHYFGRDPISTLYGAMYVFYNGTRAEKCFNLDPADEEEDPSSGGWHWQACTELVEPEMKNNNESLFPTTYTNKFMSCLNSYDVEPRPDWITTEFGGHKISKVLKKFGSNIIFFNGLRDPLSGASVTRDLSKSIVAVTDASLAHNVDFMHSSEDDLKWLQTVRKKEVRIIQRWIQEYYIDAATN